MYAVSRQWVLWRIMAHDLHHGGEIALMLGEQGISIPELGQEGGHITVPPLNYPERVRHTPEGDTWLASCLQQHFNGFPFCFWLV